MIKIHTTRLENDYEIDEKILNQLHFHPYPEETPQNSFINDGEEYTGHTYVCECIYIPHPENGIIYKEAYYADDLLHAHRYSDMEFSYLQGESDEKRRGFYTCDAEQGSNELKPQWYKILRYADKTELKQLLNQ